MALDQRDGAPMENMNAKVSRRSFLRHAMLGAVAAAGSAVSIAAEAQVRKEKATKATARYQGHPNNGESCGKCMHYTFPLTCDVVQGPVSLLGWCRFYEAR